MSEKHDAMWGPEAGEYIAQQQAEIERLRGMVKEAIGWLDGEGLYRQAASLNRDLSVTADEVTGLSVPNGSFPVTWFREQALI